MSGLKESNLWKALLAAAVILSSLVMTAAVGLHYQRECHHAHPRLYRATAAELPAG
jgi:hypothetical protein